MSSSDHMLYRSPVNGCFGSHKFQKSPCPGTERVSRVSCFRKSKRSDVENPAPAFACLHSCQTHANGQSILPTPSLSRDIPDQIPSTPLLAPVLDGTKGDEQLTLIGDERVRSVLS